MIGGSWDSGLVRSASFHCCRERARSSRFSWFSTCSTAARMEPRSSHDDLFSWTLTMISSVKIACVSRRISKLSSSDRSASSSRPSTSARTRLPNARMQSAMSCRTTANAARSSSPVSYTHLTLPTIYSV